MKHEIEEHIEQHRLSELQEARNAVRDARNRTESAVMAGKATPEQANALYLNSLQSFLHLLRPYGDRDELTRQYWYGSEDFQIGTVLADPPSMNSDEWKRQDSSTKRGQNSDTVEPKVVDRWDGLTDVLRSDRWYSARFTKHESKRNMAPAEYVATKTVTPSRPLIDIALSWTTDFCADVGLDIDVSVDESDSELQYADLL